MVPLHPTGCCITGATLFAMRVPSSMTVTFRRWLPAALVVGVIGTLVAQQPTPTPLLDGRGLPLPFGVQPYFKPDFPLGSGPYKAVMSVEPGLSAHVVYAPADLSTLKAREAPGRDLGQRVLPVRGQPVSIVPDGGRVARLPRDRRRPNGRGRAGSGTAVESCAEAGWRRPVRAPRVSRPPRRRPGGPGTRRRDRRSGTRDGAACSKRRWTGPCAQTRRCRPAASHRALDLEHIVSMGHSCGGGLAVQLATEDARINGLGIWFSGAGLVGARGNDPSSLLKIKGPVLIITGEEALDTAYASGKASFEAHQPRAGVVRLAGQTAAHRHIRRQERRRPRRDCRPLARLDDARRPRLPHECSKAPLAPFVRTRAGTCSEKKIG